MFDMTFIYFNTFRSTFVKRMSNFKKQLAGVGEKWYKSKKIENELSIEIAAKTHALLIGRTGISLLKLE